MFRHRNTDANGKPFSPAVVQAVWDKAETRPGHAPLKVDIFGTLIWREAFGNLNSKLGWEIHHRVPIDEGGSDDLDNLDAVQWENNRRLEADRVKRDEPVLRPAEPPANEVPEAALSAPRSGLLAALPVSG